ncbi:FIST signal transduction protein [Halorientalis sp.]|uniref:FIST signal transduction protein n=1 Tax=Halorientalis sp. TaxID=1931229 RepID=UPI002613E27B|nr:FIST N-terminal domain-containing protein [Halorientalis sp.]
MGTQLGTGQHDGENGYTVAVRAVEAAVDRIEGDTVDFCQVFCSTRYDYDDVLEGVHSVVDDETAVFGCSSSGEFTEEGVQAGSVVASVVVSDDIRFFTSLSTDLEDDPHRCVFEAVNALPRDGNPQLEGYPHRVAINLHDGLSGLSDQVARIADDQLGDDVTLVGGAAGDDLLLEETHVFCGEQFATDAVGLALLASKKPIPVTVNHGHTPISEPMTVTESEGGTVHELDGEPAYEVWKEAIRESAMENYEIDVDDIQDGSDQLSMMLARYEFGIESEPRSDEPGGLLGRLKSFVERTFVSTSGYNIRWPGMETTTAGPLSFAVAMPEETELRVMHSDPDDQISSVRTAARNAVDQTDDGDVAGGFVYDCFCRAAILEDEFDDALAAVESEVQAPFAGFETYGEVCTKSDDLTEYHNTTSVVMVLPA